MSAAASQQALLDAILGRGDARELRGLAGVQGGEARGLRAYRANAQALAARALAGVYGRVRDELGEADFAAMAWAFWRADPPRSGDLADWGGALAEFLAVQPEMDIGLVELARLEWAIHEAERAPDADFDAASLQLLESGEPERLRLRLRPGTALVGTCLVWRRGWRVEQQELDVASARFMRSQLDGTSLADALQLDADFDFSTWLQQALRQGFLIAVEEIQ
jgi:hypothetical protein